MANEIRANYDELDQVATRFANQAQAIQEMLQQVQGSLQKLEGNWIGLGHDKFFDEMQRLVFPVTHRLIDALEAAGRKTQEVSRTVKGAEQQAGGLFTH